MYDFRNYTSSTYVSDMLNRLLAANRAWIISMTPDQDLANRNKKEVYGFFSFTMQIIYPHQSVLLNSSVMASFVFMLIWIAGLITMFALTLRMRRENKIKEEYSALATLMDKVWQNPYGLEYLIKENAYQKNQGAGGEKEKALIRLKVKTDDGADHRVLKTSGMLLNNDAHVDGSVVIPMSKLPSSSNR